MVGCETFTCISRKIVKFHSVQAPVSLLSFCADGDGDNDDALLYMRARVSMCEMGSFDRLSFGRPRLTVETVTARTHTIFCRGYRLEQRVIAK